MITITLSWPNRRTREVLLAAIPSVGDHIQLTDDNGGDPGSLETWVVETVTYLEGKGRTPDPQVMVNVHSLPERGAKR